MMGPHGSVEEEIYVTEAERLSMVKVAATVADQSGAMFFDFQNVPLVMHFVGEDLPRPILECGDWIPNGGCPLDHLPWEAFPGVGMSHRSCARCSRGHVGNGCCKNMHGHFMTLDVLLKAANVTMSDTAFLGTIRRFGAIINVDLDFSNLENFWAWPVGFKPRFSFKARKAELTEHFGVIPEQFIEAVNNSGTAIMRGSGSSFA